MNLIPRTHLVWIVGLVLKLAAAGDCGAAPQVVEQAFANKYPGVGMPQWEIDAHGQWEARFEKDGTTLRADFTDQGTWIQTEQSIESQQLPGPVRSVIETRFGGEKLVEVEAVDSPKFGHYFDVEFKRDGGKNRDVAFDENGNEVDLSGAGTG
ncbi:MAG: PepSY-like domain-containing protein, partial [Verrucomicrobiales bacterium]